MTLDVTVCVKTLLESTVQSGAIDYSAHTWAQQDSKLLQRTIKNNQSKASMARELSWFISDYLFQGNKSSLIEKFPQVLQGFAETLTNEATFNSMPTKQVKIISEKYTRAHPRTGSVLPVDLARMSVKRRNLPKAELVKAVLKKLCEFEPALQLKVQLLEAINDYILKREQQSEYANQAGGVLAKVDIFNVANRFLGMNYAKQSKLTAIRALRQAIIYGDEKHISVEQSKVLNTGRTRELYQRYLAQSSEYNEAQSNVLQVQLS